MGGVNWVLLSEGVKRFCEVRIWKCSGRICFVMTVFLVLVVFQFRIESWFMNPDGVIQPSFLSSFCF